MAMKGPAFVVAVSFKTNARPHFKSTERARSAMHRNMIWIEDQSFQGWACSECAWVFKPLGPLVDESIEAMKIHYQQQRDKEFSFHVCAEHPRAKKGLR